MKNILSRLFVFTALILGICSISAWAEDGVDLKWHGDYQNMELVLEIKSSAKYIQKFSVVMYPSSVENPEISDYCRTAEVDVKPGETAGVRFKISEGLNAENGAYKVLIQGNGYLSAESRKEEEVYILKSSDTDDVLRKVNSANAGTVKTELEKAADALQLTVLSEEPQKRIDAFLNIKTSDFGGSFKTLEDIRAAWQLSDIIEYLSGDNPCPLEVMAGMESCSEILMINLSDEDYVALGKEIYKTLVVLNKSYGGGAGIKNISDARSIFKQSKALAAVNAANPENIETVLAKYYADLGISADTYRKFTGFSESNKQKVTRQLIGKGFTKTSDAVESFETAVNETSGSADNPSGNSGNNSGSSGGGGGAGGGIGGGTGGGSGSGVIGGGFAAGKTPDNTQNPQSGSFGDCKESHWAYEYVEELKKDGIISGYSNGNFYPEKTVTREEFVKMIVLASGIYSEGAECDFADIKKDEWCYRYIASAGEKGIINGDESGNFGAGRNISREDVAVIAQRIIKAFGSLGEIAEEGEDEANKISEEFSDGGEIYDYALESVGYLKNLGILNGFEDGSFKPKESLKRAEAAKIISMLRKYIQK